MAYNDNKDILSWKRLINAIQTNDKLRVVKESLKEGGVHKLRVDQQTHITAEHHDVVVSSNDMGIIVDIYDKKSDNIDTNTYWNDDVMESKKIKEGTWSVPETQEQVEKLTNLLKNPLNAETALDELYDVFGDDELFDDLEVMKREEPETDVRHVVIRRLKDMNFIKEVRENSVDQDWGDAGGHKRAYKVIHVDKGSMDVVARTTIEAARLFAKTKGLKSTKGIDVHLYPLEESFLKEDGAEAEDLVDIIIHRIKQNKELMLALLGDEGPDPLMNAVEIVADQYSGTTEVGSSDVSAMVDAVIRTIYPLDYHNYYSAPYGVDKEKARRKGMLELEDDGTPEYGDTNEDLAKALGMTEEELFELAERVGIDQYGGLTKDNYEDVMQHIIDNFEDYKQTHILK